MPNLQGRARTVYQRHLMRGGRECHSVTRGHYCGTFHKIPAFLFRNSCMNPELTTGLCAVSIKTSASGLRFCSHKQTVAHVHGCIIGAMPILVIAAAKHNQHIMKRCIHDCSHPKCSISCNQCPAHPTLYRKTALHNKLLQPS